MDRFGSKQPYEEYYIAFDFANYLGSAAISTATTTAAVYSTGADATATILTSAEQTIIGKVVYVWVKAGSSGAEYRITCRIVADDGSKYELDGLLMIAEE